jgi:beta-ureidopropionase / N-carbamoyl-L-amino-acid hydrolase
MERSLNTLPPIVINADRLWETLEASARIGAIDGNGLGRLALSEADGQMRDLFVAWSKQADFDVCVDQIGNIFVRRPGEDADAAPVMMGSHLDTQVHGGRFDGILGVLAGLETLSALNDANIRTRRAVEVVSWTDEEGARFHRAMLGSSVFAGDLSLEDALSRHDDRGVTVDQALRLTGYGGGSPVPGRLPHAYLELHIEQNSVLEEAGVDVGIVDGSYPIYHMDVHFEGRTAHSGPTPMAKRRNALTGAAHAIAAVDQIARSHEPDAKSTTSAIHVWPNRPGIIPSSVDVRFDFRHPHMPVLEEMRDQIENAVAAAATAANVDTQITALTRFGDARFDSRIVATLEEAAAAEGIDSMRLPTQAGHDALVIASVAPAAMLFCPCRDGVSHHPDEDIDYPRVLSSVAVLARSALTLAENVTEP